MRRQILQLSAVLAVAACAKETPQPPFTLDAGPEFVDLATHGGFHLNADYPVNFKPEGGERVDVKASWVTTPCAKEPEQQCTAHMSVPNAAGVLAFSYCSADVCNIEKVQLSKR